MSPPTGARTTTRVRLKPANPFDLIRLLARSQSDPRKAVCELVQNSLDASARRVDVTWQSDHGARMLRVWDDGTGVFPELTREDALRRIATTIGHSHKRSLTPAERRELMALGKYGIGLLGFWSVGKHMEIKSRTAGGDVWALRLEEDRPEAVIERLRARRIDEAPTFTEIVIRPIHEGAARQIRPGRLQAYFASELRGQLLGREVEIHIHDRVARGRAHKHFVVRPTRFFGRHLTHLPSLTVTGHEDARLELYLVQGDDERRGVVQLACGGSTVLDDLTQAWAEEGGRAPWDSGRIEGVIDFPELEVAPGTRRGFQRDAAALAFLDAMARLEMELMALVHEDDRARSEQKDRSLAREIRRVFRGVARMLPEYDLFDVRSRGGGGEPSTSAESGPGEALAPGAIGPGAIDAGAIDIDRAESVEETPMPPDASEPTLFPPGPLARVRVQPARLRVGPGAVRRLRARALDADGRVVQGAVLWTWTLEGQGELASDEGEARYTAPGDSATARIVARGTQDECSAEGVVEVAVLAELAAQERVSGIPEPIGVHAPGETWRSRMRGGSWEFNSGHRDYQAVLTNETRRVRYVVHLFAKEVVLRNFGQPAEGAFLERMVEVLTHLDTGRTGERVLTEES